MLLNLALYQTHGCLRNDRGEFVTNDFLSYHNIQEYSSVCHAKKSKSCELVIV
jgi:hypothetical protein